MNFARFNSYLKTEPCGRPTRKQLEYTMPRLVFVVALHLLALLPLLAIGEQQESDRFVEIGSRRELFVDELLIDRLEGEARRVLQHPVPREIALVCDKPWEGNGLGYVTVMQDGDLYRMYYRGADYHYGVTATHPQTYCYAESHDGIRWTRPEINLIEFAGSKQNNIVISEEQFGGIAHNFSPFFDTRPGVPADQRFKAIGGAPLHLLVSIDGIRWRKSVEAPVITEGAFDSQNLVFWDVYRKSYRAYHREFRDGRDIMTETSDNLIDWTKPEFLNYEPSRGGELYTSQITPYHRAPHILLGFPTRYEDRGSTPATRHLPQHDYRQARGAGSAREGTAVTEGMLMASRDGLNFHVWQEAFVRPGLRTKDSWFYGDNYQNLGIVETRSTLADDAPDELSMYFTEGTLQNGKPAKLRRYTLRIDGFVAVNAPMTGGRLVTVPIRFTGERLSINYASSARGGIRIGFQNEARQPIPGLSLDECPWIYGDSLNRTVEWNRDEGVESDVSSLAGQVVRLVFELKDADLFSFQFAAD
jgi:hypothetical protein